MIAQIQSQNLDPKTGRPLFRPQNGRSPLDRSIETRSAIGDHLYDQYKKTKEKKKRLEEEH